MAARKILLVDDVDFFLELEKDLLNQTPAQIMTAKNGREALDLVARERPNLIFMDVNMPVMDGLTCCRALKGDPRFSDIPIVMVFAPSKEVTAETCREAGCDGVVTKPLDRRAFLEMGRTFLFQIDRREGRVPCDIPVTIRLPGGEIAGRCADLSQGGMYVACREEVRPSQTVRLAVHFAGSSQPLEIRVRVAWVNQGSPRLKIQLPQGFGAQFLHLDPTAKAFIREITGRTR